MVKIGIDFGTTNTTVSYIDKTDHVRNLGGKIKSALYFFDDFKGSMYGLDAIDYAKMEPEDCVNSGLVKNMKRRLDPNAREYIHGMEFSYTELIGKFLELIKENIEQDTLHGDNISAVCVTHPVEFTDEKVNILKCAAEMAGFKEVKTLQEPIAAAMGYMDAIQQKEGYIFKEENFLIFDFGGGTLDLAFVEVTAHGLNLTLPTLGDDKCGGENIDLEIYKMFDRAMYSEHRLHLTGEDEIDPKFLTFICEPNKELLSRHFNKNKERPLVIQAIKKGKRIRIEVNYSLWRDLIDPTINRAMDLVDKMMHQIRANNKLVDKVILIGGSTSIPEVKLMIKERFGLECFWIDEERDVAVANGAAIFANKGTMPIKCFCTHCGKQLNTSVSKCDKCLTDNYLFKESIKLSI